MRRVLASTLLLLGILSLGAWLWQGREPTSDMPLDLMEPQPSGTAPVLLGSSGRESQKKEKKREEQRLQPLPEPDPVAAPEVQYVMTGTVLERATGQPIPDAVVLGMIGTDAWALRTWDAELVRATTDAAGEYELVFLLSELPTKLVFTALAAGYRTPGAMPEEREGGVGQTGVTVQKEGRGTLDFALTSGMEVAGVVVDEDGRPVPGVGITVTENTESSTSYVEFPFTDEQGRFSVHDLTRPQFNRNKAKGTLDFAHPERVAVRIEDVYTLSPEARRALRVVMPVGLRLQGTVRHDNGEPAVGVLVSAYAGESNTGRRGAYADEAGRFELRGLAAGNLILRAHSGERLSFVRKEITLLRHEDDFDLRLEAASIRHSARREKILGLELVFLPPEARTEFDFYERHAMLITAITDEAPAGIRERARVGDILWRVGRIWVASTRDVAKGVVQRVDSWTKIAAKRNRPAPEEYGVRFVIGMRRPDLDGTYTGSMKVPATRVEALRRFLEKHPESD